MSYSVKELKEKIGDHILNLGVDKRFLDTPAFASALNKIDSLISEMNMGKSAEVVSVSEKNGEISFEWMNNVGDKYSMNISSSDPKTFKSVKVEEKKPFYDADGDIIRTKTVTEENATIDENNFVTLTTNSADINDINCKKGECNVVASAERGYYDPFGVMKEREYKGFYNLAPFPHDFSKLSINSALLAPRDAFGSSFGNNRYDYSKRMLLVRKKLDVARVIIEDQNGVKYSSETLLSQQYGLRDMQLPNTGGAPYPQEEVINPLTQEEIDAIIAKESNQKVAEGLKLYAQGRTTYSYNSADDPYYKNESRSEGFSR